MQLCVCGNSHKEFLWTYIKTSMICVILSNYLTWDKSGMDVVRSLQQDPINAGVIDPFNTKTPHQEPQKTCTRNLPCLQQGCTPTTRFATTSWKQTWYSFFTTAQTSVPTIRIRPRSCWRFVPQIIKTLQANSEIIQQFNAEDLHSISLIQLLIQNIIRSEIDFHQSVHGIQTPISCQCPTSCLHVLAPRPVCEQVGKELLIEPFSF